jgi:hypothetical protein
VPSNPTSDPHWTEPGAFEVAAGVHRIPLPLPLGGLRVDVYGAPTLTWRIWLPERR